MMLRRRQGGGIRSLRSVVRVWFCRSWSTVEVVGAAPERINLPQLHFHIGGVLHGGVSELMASCVCRFLELAALSFLDSVVEAEAAIPSGVFFLLFCPCCYGVGSDVMVKQGDMLSLLLRCWLRCHGGARMCCPGVRANNCPRRQ
jgi:hypothetical protein